tara:strand:+ start:12 stop:218 length:207 start_codon:yes stop_codon:yes gene_type:complete
MSKKWEYITEIIEAPSIGMTVTELNSRGNVGWELVSVREYNKTSDDTDADQSTGRLITEYIFKRKISK